MDKLYDEIFILWIKEVKMSIIAENLIKNCKKIVKEYESDNKEIHILLTQQQIDQFENNFDNVQCTIFNTEKWLDTFNKVYTTQTHFCSTTWLVKGYRIFAHMLDDEVVEIKLGKNECTDREIRVSHNLEKMLLANEFGLATLD